MAARVDAVVIGSGASGSVLAYELARQGMSVVVLERGARHEPSSFRHDELATFTAMYEESGLQSSVDRSITVVQGTGVGGSTVINNAIWMRADLDRVMPAWERAGAPVNRGDLVEAYTELEQALHVSPLPRGQANRGAEVFLRGAANLGIEAELLSNNRQDCLGCGWCNYGCRYNRKTSMLVTFVPWAEARGALVIDRCDDIIMKRRRGQVTAVSALHDGKRVQYDPGVVVVCAGAIASSALLLRNSINPNGQVGRRLHVLGGVFTSAECLEPVDGFDGIGLCCVARADPEYVLESYFAPPVAFSLRTSGFFADHYQRMTRYRYFADAGVMVGTDPANGRVKIDRTGRPRIHLRIGPADLERLKRGMTVLARLFLAAGVRAVYPSTYQSLVLATTDDLHLINDVIAKPRDLILGSAHPQGGNTMSLDPRRGVVGPDFRVHGYDNLFIADTSVWPSNIWANCQATAMAMAHYAAKHIVAAGGRR